MTDAYSAVRDMMCPGDLIAFGGSAGFSEIIKWATKSDVSHVGAVFQTRATYDDSGRFFNQVIESTKSGSSGVQINRLSERIETYEGNIWWLKLNRSLRFDQVKFFEFMFAQKGKGYDLKQAILAGSDTPFGEAVEDFGRFFCSELVAAGLEVAGILPGINASEVTPIDLCRVQIWESCVQLKGDALRISRYNTIPRDGWIVA